ncbi:hypothetical protein MN032_08735 [Agromyces atrinae]|uniref:hypothetical protein n=1 Tax=Agromyces atrinae TaxID=592376 RepID=UPI001F5AAC4E|nr:hypothetical protein [Agromyces atrinae]MCI2957776.1 hypothetical protein [Agromyces atrinae]
MRRRRVAAAVALVPAVLAILLVIVWWPLPPELDAQWAGDDVISRQPTWLLLGPAALLVALGCAISVGEANARGHASSAGAVFAGALLIAAPVAFVVGLLAVNRDAGLSIGPLVIGSFAAALVWAIGAVGVARSGGSDSGFRREDGVPSVR